MQVGRVSPRAPHMAVLAAAKFLALGKNGAKPHTSEGGELQEGGGEESLSVTKPKEDDSLPSDEDSNFLPAFPSVSLVRTTAPAPSPNRTHVLRSSQSTMLLSFSAPITNAVLR